MPKKQKSTLAKTPPTKRTAHLAESAFQRLQHAILTRELKQGDTVREQRLAREWNIGRTPMREAFRRAAEFGYLILRPNQAPTVRQLSPDDILKIYSIRELLECQALREAAKNIRPEDIKKVRTLANKAEAAVKGRLAAQLTFDASLHDLWFVNCDNVWLAQAIERLLIYRPNLSNLLVNRRVLAEEAFAEHIAILEAIEAGDFRKAARLLGQHIRGSAIIIARLTEEPLAYT